MGSQGSSLSFFPFCRCENQGSERRYILCPTSHEWEEALPGWTSGLFFSSNSRAQATQVNSVITAPTHTGSSLEAPGKLKKKKKKRFLSIIPDLLGPNLQRCFLFFKVFLIGMMTTKFKIKLHLGWGEVPRDFHALGKLDFLSWVKCAMM